MHAYNVVRYAKQELLKHWTGAFVGFDQVSPIIAGCNSGSAAHVDDGVGGTQGMPTLPSRFLAHVSRFQVSEKAVKNRRRGTEFVFP